MDSWTNLVGFSKTNSQILESIDTIEKALTTYGPENTCISFNGGKDCTAVVHLVQIVCSKLYVGARPRLMAFYAPLPNHFEEEAKFVDRIVSQYDMKLLQYPSESLKQSLMKLKSDLPNLNAIFVGTRKDDLKPGASLDNFAPTDDDWPKLMRINPILNWSYEQVWSFINHFEVPYCDLYNQGYSSIGTKDDTKKNPNLIRHGIDGQPYYIPAWRLTGSKEERTSRSSS